MADEHNPTSSDIGTVMVDIGEGAGAVIVWTAADLLGAEIEVRRADRPWDGTHVAVLERRTGDGSRHAALFGSLPVGDYELRRRPPQEGGAVVPVTVGSGQISEVTWPG